MKITIWKFRPKPCQSAKMPP